MNPAPPPSPLTNGSSSQATSCATASTTATSLAPRTATAARCLRPSHADPDLHLFRHYTIPPQLVPQADARAADHSNFIDSEAEHGAMSDPLTRFSQGGAHKSPAHRPAHRQTCNIRTHPDSSDSGPISYSYRSLTYLLCVSRAKSTSCSHSGGFCRKRRGTTMVKEKYFILACDH